jgi:hypothetical protein
MTDSNQKTSGDKSPETSEQRTVTNTRRQLLGSIGGLGLGTVAVNRSAARRSNGQGPDPDDYEDILADADGDGSKDDPYILTTVEELQAMEGDLDAHYELGNSIDARATKSWNRSKGFDPISDFEGSLDGQGYEIERLYIVRPDESDIGLFGEATEGQIEDLSIRDADITGGDDVGTFIGDGENCAVVNSNATGSVSGDRSVGGLIGFAFGGEITDSYSEQSVTGSGRVGGLVGSGDNLDVSSSYTTGSVSSDGRVGGLIGSDESSTITDSYATGTVDSNGSTVGGLLGFGTTTEITASFATGTVSGDESVGGLVGAGESVSVHRSYATGDVSGTDKVGGLAGNDIDGINVTVSYATGSVTGEESVGGLLGADSGCCTRMRNSYATGAVDGTTYVGGLVGSGTGGSTVEESYAAGPVTGDEGVGGLLGDGFMAITSSYWDVPATGQTESDGDGELTGTGLGTLDDEPPADEMTGEDAEENMDGFDFDTTWKTVVDPDDYPVLLAFEEEVVFWQIDFAEGAEPPTEPRYWPKDLMAALGNTEDGVTRNPAPRRQNKTGQLGDLSIDDNEFKFDDQDSPTEATVEFELDRNADARDLHLAAFVLPGPFDEDEIDEQELFETTSETFEGGDSGVLTVSIPQESND